MEQNPETARTGTAAKPTLTVLSKGKQRPKKSLPTDRIHPAKQFMILRAYGAVSGDERKPVKNADVGAIVKLNADTVSLANGYFVENGFLERAPQGGGFMPAQEVLDYHHAHQWNPDTAAQSLAPIVKRSWFYQVLEPKLSFGTFAEAEALEDLARAANATPDYKPQLRALIDYLETTGVVQREGGMLRKGTGKADDISREEPQQQQQPQREEAVVNPAPGMKPNVATRFAKSNAGGVQFNVDVNVDMAEFSSWSPDRIAAFFSGIAQVLAAKSGVEEG